TAGQARPPCGSLPELVAQVLDLGAQLRLPLGVPVEGAIVVAVRSVRTAAKAHAHEGTGREARTEAEKELRGEEKLKHRRCPCQGIRGRIAGTPRPQARTRPLRPERASAPAAATTATLPVAQASGCCSRSGPCRTGRQRRQPAQQPASTASASSSSSRTTWGASAAG